jgi:catechol 2,3-dioxygenase-like lactoylglutathione lyase family enzyme
MLQRVGHIALLVSNLKEAVALFTEALGAKVTRIYEAGEADQLPDGGAFLNFGGMHHDVLLIPAKTGQRPGLHHVAFYAEGEEALTSIRDRLRQRGVQVGDPVTHGDQGPRAIYSGSRALYFPGPDGILMEASYGMLTLAELGGSLTAHERTPARDADA